MRLTFIGPGGNLVLSPALGDAFGRLRVSNPQSLFDSKQVYDDGTPLIMVHDVTGAGASTTYDQTNARTILDCGTTAAGRATRQSRRYINYQPGKGQLCDITFNFNGAEPNCEKRAGVFNGGDGVFLALPESGTPSFTRRSSSAVPTESVSQPDWNIDKMDGSGVSGVVLDLTKAQILVMDYQWLGVGTWRCGFNINGITHYAHEFENANIVSGVYIGTPNLPVRWEIVGTGASPANPTMDAICCSVLSEGGQEPVGFHRGFPRTTPLAILAGATLPLLSVRLKATHNRAPVFPTAMGAAATTNNSRGTLQLILNGSLTAPTWALPQTNSAVEADIAATAVAGGTVIAALSIGGDSGQADLAFAEEPAVTFASDFAGVADTLTLALTSIANDDWIGAINWRELL